MCQIIFGIDVKLTLPSYTKNTILSIFLVLAGLSAFITIGGLSSLQANCAAESVTPSNVFPGVYGFTSSHSCKKIFSWYWFITAGEFVIVALGLYSVFRKKADSARGAIVGLFVIFSLLYIYQTDAFLTASQTDYYTSTLLLKDRSRTMVAGSIMTAVLNVLIVLVAGYGQETAPSAL